MADYARNAGGELFARTPGGEWLPIEPGDVDIIEQGALERFGGAASAGVETIYEGARTLLTGDDERFRELQREGDVRDRYGPLSNALGDVAPDVAIGALTGGAGGIGSALGRTALVEGALGAARNPDAPVMGALLQGGVGAAGAGIGRAAGSLMRRARPGIGEEAYRAAGGGGMGLEDIVDAPGSASGLTPAQTTRAQGIGLRLRALAGVGPGRGMTREARDALGMGFKLPPSRKSSNPGLGIIEAKVETLPGGASVFDEQIRAPNQLNLNRRVAEGLGLRGADGAPLDRVRIEDLAQFEDELVKGLADDAFAVQDVATGGIRRALQAARRETNLPDSQAKIDKMIDLLPDGYVSGRDAYTLMTDFQERAAQFGGKDGPAASAARSAVEASMETLADSARGETTKSAIRAFKERYALTKALQLSGVVNAAGDVSPKTLYNRLKASPYTRARLTGKNAATDEGVASVYETAKAATAITDLIGNSGTASRSLSLEDPMTYLGRPLAQAFLGNYLGAAGTLAVPAGAGALGVGLVD